MFRLITISFLGFAIIGCAATLTKDKLIEVYQSHSDPSLSVENTGIVELGTTDWLEVSGSLLKETIMIGFRGDKKTNYGSISLLPGEYSFTWGRDFMISILIDPDMHEEFWVTQKFFVEPGHTYRLQSTRSTGAYIQGYFWVEDVTSGYKIWPGCQTDEGKGVGTILNLAEQGNKEAQYQLAIWYKRSKCFNQRYEYQSNPEKAAYWLGLAAESGDSRAQYELARAYHTGSGIDLDLVRARELYQLSANQGDARAEYNLGLFYHKGLGGEQNLHKAQHWYQKAANKEHFSAKKGLKDVQKEINCEQDPACQPGSQ